MKLEYEDVRRFGYCSAELFCYQIKGFTIEIYFVESGTNLKINSIFYLWLVSVDIHAEHILFYFTHEELEHELAAYEVSKKKVKKIERKEHPFEPHVYHN